MTHNLYCPRCNSTISESVAVVPVDMNGTIKLVKHRQCLHCGCAAPENEPVKTGQAPEMMQDDCRELAKWLASKPEAKQLVRQMMAEKSAPQELAAWLVCSVNSDGSLSLEHAAAWQEAAHNYINDAITEHGIEDAALWVVRPAYTAPPTRKPTDAQVMAAARVLNEGTSNTFGISQEKAWADCGHMCKALALAMLTAAYEVTGEPG